jgi:hypothetical protein
MMMVMTVMMRCAALRVAEPLGAILAFGFKFYRDVRDAVH